MGFTRIRVLFGLFVQYYPSDICNGSGLTGKFQSLPERLLHWILDSRLLPLPRPTVTFYTSVSGSLQFTKWVPVCRSNVEGRVVRWVFVGYSGRRRGPGLRWSLVSSRLKKIFPNLLFTQNPKYRYVGFRRHVPSTYLSGRTQGNFGINVLSVGWVGQNSCLHSFYVRIWNSCRTKYTSLLCSILLLSYALSRVTCHVLFALPLEYPLSSEDIESSRL